MRTLWLLCFILLLASCTLEKRLYRDGFYINRKHTSAAPAPSHSDKRTATAPAQALNNNAAPVVVNDSMLPAAVTEASVNPENIPTDTTRKKRLRKPPGDTVPTEEEEPARIETGSGRWRNAGYAALVAFLGLTIGLLLLAWIFYDWLTLAFGAVVISGVLLLIFLSMRSHRRFKKQDPLAAKQTTWGVIGRWLLYVFALTGAALIFEMFILWTLQGV